MRISDRLCSPEHSAGPGWGEVLELPPAVRPLPEDAMYRLLVQGVTDYAIYMLSPEGVVVNWNAGAERAKGYAAAEIVGHHFSCFYAPEDRAAGLPGRGLAAARETGRFEAEGWRLRKDGSRFWAHVVIDAIRDGGRLVGFAKITRDRTEQHRAAVMLKAASDNLDLALSNMSDGLCLLDRAGRLVLANGRLGEILGLDAAALRPGLPLWPILRRILGPEQTVRIVRAHLRPEAGEPVLCECVRDGRILSIRSRALEAGGWVATCEDVSERRVVESRIRHLVHHDALTGAANGAVLRMRLEERLREGAPCAVLCIGLDRFKPVNDDLGHAAGDDVLTQAAARIAALLGPGDLVARLGGDEFAALLGPADRADHAENAAAAATAMVQALALPFDVAGVQVAIGASIGVAAAPGAGTAADALLASAGLALLQAKAEGRGCWRLYETGMGDRALARRALERDLRRALREDGFELHYQPIFRGSCGTLVGFEALLRWRRPDGRMVPPADFIPLAEQAGLMPDIGAWVLEEACRTAAGWPEPLVVAVNVSPTQLRGPEFLATVERALAASGLRAGRLELEITETAILENRDLALGLLGRLRALGAMVALDDFGTGYSSLSFVHSFPLTRIKVDRSFVQGLGRNPHSIAIVRAVTSLADSLGIAVTAEGVETLDQLRTLIAERCHDVQGFLLGRPMPRDDLAPFLRTRRALRPERVAEQAAAGEAPRAVAGGRRTG